MWDNISDKHQKRYNEIEWERPNKIANLTNNQGFPELFHGAIEPNDIA